MGAVRSCEELVGKFFACPEWFVLRSFSLFLVGGVDQMWELCISARSYTADRGGATGQIFCLVLNGLCFGPLPHSSYGYVEQMWEPCIRARSYIADGGGTLADFFLVLHGLCFGPLPYSSQGYVEQMSEHLLKYHQM